MNTCRNGKSRNIKGWVAEAVGFEPTVRFPVRSVSNRVLSASQPRLRSCDLMAAKVGGKWKGALTPGFATGSVRPGIGPLHPTFRGPSFPKTTAIAYVSRSFVWVIFPARSSWTKL